MITWTNNLMNKGVIMFKKRKRYANKVKSLDTSSNGPIQINEIPHSTKTKEEATDTEAKRVTPYRFEPNPKYFTISIYVLVVFIITIVITQIVFNIPFLAKTLDHFLFVVQPFIVAFFIAFIINPIVKVFSNQLFGRLFRIRNSKACLALGILTAYLMVIGLMVGFCFYVVPQISDSIAKLTEQLPGYYNQIFDFLNTLESRFPTLDLGWIEEKLNEWLPQFISIGTDFVRNVFPKLLDFSISIARLLLNILLSIAISIYMLYDKRTLSKNATRVLYAFVPKKKATSILKLTKECGCIFTNFIVGKAIDSSIIGILCFILMSLLKLDYALLLSVIVGVTNMIPYFGPFIGAVPGILIYLCIAPLDAVLFAFMILVLQQFDGWILGPKILGDSTGLTPLWVIFGITIGGAYGGVFGMFLGVPMVAVVAYLADLFISYRLKKRHLEIK